MTKVYKNRLSEEQLNEGEFAQKLGRFAGNAVNKAKTIANDIKTGFQQTYNQPSTQSNQTTKQVVSQQPVQTQATQVSQQAPVQQATPTQQVQQSASQNNQTTNGQTQPVQQSTPTQLKNKNNQAWYDSIMALLNNGTYNNNEVAKDSLIRIANAISTYDKDLKEIVITDQNTDKGIHYFALIEKKSKEQLLLESINIDIPKFMQKRLKEWKSAQLPDNIDANTIALLNNEFSNIKKVIATTGNNGQVTNSQNSTSASDNNQSSTTTNDNQATDSQNLQVNSTTQANNNSKDTKTGKSSTDEGAEPTQEQKQELSNIAKGNLTEFANAFVNVFISQIEEINNYLKKFNNPLEKIEIKKDWYKEKKNLDLTPKTFVTLVFRFTNATDNSLAKAVEACISKSLKNNNNYPINGVNFSVSPVVGKTLSKDKSIFIYFKVDSTAQIDLGDLKSTGSAELDKAKIYQMFRGNKKELKKFNKLMHPENSFTNWLFGINQNRKNTY